jgi:hypothetical protein
MADDTARGLAADLAPGGRLRAAINFGNSAPYVVIEGVHVVAKNSPLRYPAAAAAARYGHAA